MSFDYFSKNGTILPLQEAHISLDNIEYQYGYGVYESLKVRHGLLYFVEQHVERLFSSASILELEHTFSKSHVISYIHELVTKLNIDACNIKMLLIGASKPEDAQLYILPLAPLYPERSLYKRGANVITVQYERWFPHAKSLNMLPSYMAYKKAKEAGAYEGLLIDAEGSILEGTRTNFFAMREKTLYMPPLEKVLEGVTLITVLHVAKQHGYFVEETNIKLQDLLENKYDAAFVTSTSSKIIPIQRIDTFSFPAITEPLHTLMKAYDEFLITSGGVFNQ